MPRVDILSKFPYGFYFGVGGLGDAILLLSSFYPKETLRPHTFYEPLYGVIFWTAASSPKLLKEFFECFPQLGEVVLTKPPASLDQRQRVFEELTSHPMFRGAAHTPRHLDYVGEWSVRADHYRQVLPRRWPELLRLFPPYIKPSNKKLVGVGAWGSNVNVDYKHRRLSQVELIALCQKIISQGKTPCIFGSAQDLEQYPLPSEIASQIRDVRGYSLREALCWLNTCSELISVDTWYLQWARLVKIPTTVIKTRYSAPPELIFEGGVDPSDRLFLHNWGFNILSLEEILNT